MKHVCRFPMLRSFVVALALMSYWASAGSGDPLVLELSFPDGKSEFLSCLPVIPTIEIKNASATPQGVSGFGLGSTESPLNENPPRIRFVVTHPDGTTVPIHFTDWVNWRNNSRAASTLPSLLEPGGRQTVDYRLGYGVDSRISDVLAGRKTLSSVGCPVAVEPGEYEVYMILTWYVPNGLWSNRLRFTIVRPTNPSDVAAHEILLNSKWPQLFLSPPLCPFAWHGVEPPGHSISIKNDTISSSPMATCRQILQECADSSYAPYARLFFGAALAMGWGEGLEEQPAQSLEEFRKRARRPVDVNQRREGLLLLQAAVEDPGLPRRYRDRAVECILWASKSTNRKLQVETRKEVDIPSLKTLLGRDIPDWPPISSETVYAAACQLSAGIPEDQIPRLHAVRQLLTPEELDAIKTLVAENPSLALAAGVHSVQMEFQKYRVWASERIGNVPWRDSAGRLTMGLQEQRWP